MQPKSGSRGDLGMLSDIMLSMTASESSVVMLRIT
jgi:hypothetical protein